MAAAALQLLRVVVIWELFHGQLEWRGCLWRCGWNEWRQWRKRNGCAGGAKGNARQGGGRGVGPTGRNLEGFWANRFDRESRGRDESERRRAESQWIVAARPLCHLQYPVAYLSRLQRILPAARWESHFMAARAAHPPCGLHQRHVPLGARRPLLRVGNRAAGACAASGPDSDLEAFSHNPAHGSFAPLAFQPSAMTNCANQRFLSY
ncbi:hypothetical protein L1049_000754 [Liquidambar formosana]|uniref:Uncharacterized protein n=1 Tax=Liquidambar formosana TaxID=63359 RepID=A0AAP0NB53_LIQFO